MRRSFKVSPYAQVRSLYYQSLRAQCRPARLLFYFEISICTCMVGPRRAALCMLQSSVRTLRKVRPLCLYSFRSISFPLASQATANRIRRAYYLRYSRKNMPPLCYSGSPSHPAHTSLRSPSVPALSGTHARTLSHRIIDATMDLWYSPSRY